MHTAINMVNEFTVKVSKTQELLQLLVTLRGGPGMDSILMLPADMMKPKKETVEEWNLHFSAFTNN